MGEALPVPRLHGQCSHVRARVRDHKGSGLSRIPAPRHSLPLWQGWRKPPAPGRMEADGGDGGGGGRSRGRGGGGRGGTQTRNYHHCPPFPTALRGCSHPGSPSPPLAGSGTGPDPAPHPGAGAAPFPRGWGMYVCLPPQPPWAAYTPSSPKSSKRARNLINRPAKRPAAPSLPPCPEGRAAAAPPVGTGTTTEPGELLPVRGGGVSGRLHPAAPGRVRTTPAVHGEPESAAPVPRSLPPRPAVGPVGDVPAPRWRSCCRQRRKTDKRAGRLRRRLFISPEGDGRAARPARGAGAPSGPPRRLSQQRGPGGRSRTALRPPLTPPGIAGRSSAALSRGTGWSVPAPEHDRPGRRCPRAAAVPPALLHLVHLPVLSPPAGEIGGCFSRRR